MKSYLFALALSLFYDCAPENASVDQYPFIGETRSRLKEMGWEIRRWEKKPEDVSVFWNLGQRIKEADLAGIPKEKMVLFVWEPPTVQKELYDPKWLAYFGKIFTWDDALVDNKRYFKFHYPVLKERGEVVPFEKKKFCTMVAGRLCSDHPKQLYKEREATIRFFEDKPGEFDLYGKYWEKRKFKNWRGPIDDKMAVIKNYKFSICYENTRDVKGYITEKIFDCFAAGVVPVYWGASNVTEYIPEGCFVDRRKFKDNKAMYKFLKRMSQEEYEGYLKRAEVFLKSEKARLFSGEHFAKTFMKVLDNHSFTMQKPSS